MDDRYRDLTAGQILLASFQQNLKAQATRPLPPPPVPAPPQWSAYEAAVNDMVAGTSTEFAPWTLVAGNDKKFARIQIFKAVCEGLEEAL